MLAIVAFTISACKFDSFHVGAKWNCIPGGRFPEYQYPRLCSPSNEYVPATFEVLNHTDGESWKLRLKPFLAYKIQDGKKTLQYTFDIDKFVCNSLDDFNVDITVIPVNERDPDSWKGELLWLLVLIVLLLTCMSCHDKNDSTSSSAFWGAWLGSRTSNERAHFE